ncbi:MAG: 2-oxoacid:acceptor oxidoreductase subunit alpha [Candidatus Aminicenantes bacterium]|nr:2-oxoacid:acceptor oxidoreductase subunit alpha [Candidatus Aminicenantes bacterium]
MNKFKDDISIVLCGEAGQGIQTVERILTHVLKLSGFNVFATKEYMSRIRGGSNSTEIRVSSKKVSSLAQRIDILIPLSKSAIEHVKRRISPYTIIIGEKENIPEGFPVEKYRVIDVAFSKMASDIGGRVYSNIIGAGVISGLFKVKEEILRDYLKQHFSKKSEDIIQRNIEAVKKGYEIAEDLLNTERIEFDLQRDPRIRDEILINGAEAVGLGALAGGCNFISSYPMSPSTGVLVFLSQQMNDFEVLAEQAEDEISAINMAIGAWYAGGRAMVTTSGGGFSLMIEGLSLAGMLETPVVIHLAQRPGPATGLPTRTEQADLDLALYAGHGEFPRIILAPGKLEDGFYLTQRAFNLADKYQVPVFVLTDQYFIDSYYNIPALEVDKTTIDSHIIKTDKNYQRYRLTENGISPRGIPGHGEGLVVVDSDEHDEEGHITEDLELRTQMVNKRLKKLESIKKEVLAPELIGNKNYKNLVIGWGSTYHVVKESLEGLKREDTSFLHFKQVYPLHPETERFLQKTEKAILVENNATAQLGKLIKLNTGLEIENKILKYNGLAFTVEEVRSNLEKYL